MSRNKQAEHSPPIGISRRHWIATSAATLGYACLARGQEPPVEVDVSNPRNHCCIELPIVDPRDPPEKRAKESPEEHAILERQVPNVSLAASAPASEDTANAPQSAPARAAYLSSWDDRIGKSLRIHFMGGPVDVQNKVFEVARQWCDYANLDFERESNRQNADIRISFVPALGHQSVVGPSPAGANRNDFTMNLAIPSISAFDDGYTEWVVLHEFGHALGCIHEHLRDDVPFQFKSPQAVLSYFLGTRRFTRADQVQYNIFDRINTSTLIKFSEFDAQSVMNYFLPGFLFANNEPVGQDRASGYGLSPLDKKFAIYMYPGRKDPEGNLGGGGTPTTTVPSQPPPVQLLSIDGAAVSAEVRPGIAASFKLSVPAGTGPLTIATEGSTQVVLQLFGPNDAAREITFKSALEHGTYDLSNDVIQRTLEAGEYTVKAVHASPRGGGKFSIAAKNGSKFKRLLESNPIQLR